jgi:hypothetical protein
MIFPPPLLLLLLSQSQTIIQILPPWHFGQTFHVSDHRLCQSIGALGDVVPSLQHAADSATAAAARVVADCRDRGSQPTVVVFGQPQIPPQRVVLVPVEPGRQHHQLRVKPFQLGQHHVAEGFPKLSRAPRDGATTIAAVHQRGVVQVTGKERDIDPAGQMNTGKENIVVLFKNFTRAVAEMNVEVDDGDSGDAPLDAGVADSDGDVVQQAETMRTTAVGPAMAADVVPRWTDQTKRWQNKKKGTR